MLSSQWDNDNQHFVYIIVSWYLLGIITRQGFLFSCSCMNRCTCCSFQAVYKLRNGFLPLEEVVEPEKYASRVFAVAELPTEARMDFAAFKHVTNNSKTTMSLVEAITKAACQPYFDRKQKTGSIGRKRASTVVEHDKAQDRPRSRSQRGFTVWTTRNKSNSSSWHSTCRDILRQVSFEWRHLVRNS